MNGIILNSSTGDGIRGFRKAWGPGPTQTLRVVSTQLCRVVGRERQLGSEPTCKAVLPTERLKEEFFYLFTFLTFQTLEIWRQFLPNCFQTHICESFNLVLAIVTLTHICECFNLVLAIVTLTHICECFNLVLAIVTLTFSRLMTYIYIYIYIYMSYRTANLQTFHFIYLFNKYTYWIF